MKSPRVERLLSGFVREDEEDEDVVVLDVLIALFVVGVEDDGAGDGANLTALAGSTTTSSFSSTLST